MKKLNGILGSFFLLHVLSLMLVSEASAQFAFELPNREQEEFHSYDEIQVEVTGKLALSTATERGHILLEVKGGLPPYSFKWNSRQTSQNRVNLQSGTYTVEIIDAAGTKHIEHVIIHPPVDSRQGSMKKSSNSADLRRMKMVKSKTNLVGKRQSW